MGSMSGAVGGTKCSLGIDFAKGWQRLNGRRLQTMKMKSIFGALFLSALGAAVAGAERLNLSQEEAVERALEKNLSLRIQRLDQEIREEAVRQAKGAFDPVLRVGYADAFTTSARNGEAANLEIRGKLGNGAVYTLGVDTQEALGNGERESFGGASVRQPLLRGRRMDTDRAEVKRERLRLDASGWSLKRETLKTIESVIAAYNSLFLVVRNAEIARLNRDRAEQLVEDNRKLIEQGMMAPVELAVAEAELAVREDRALRFASLKVESENELKKLIFEGFEDASQVTVQLEGLPELEAFDYEFTHELEGILESQPDLRIREIAVEIASVIRDREASRRLPDLSVVASFGYRALGDSFGDSLSRLGDGEEEGRLGLELEFPLGNREAASRSAASRLRWQQEQVRLDQLKQEVLLDLDSQYVRVRTNWQRIQTSRKARELSEITLDAEQKKLKAGSSSSFVILRLQNDLAVAQAREFQAQSDYQLSLARLARLRGTF